MTYTTPNIQVPDQVTNWCLYPYSTNPPCINRSPPFNTARSFHTGGVNVLLADGSVRFIKNAIDRLTWQGLSSINAAETISPDQY